VAIKTNELRATTSNGKANPACQIAGPPITAVIATAPPGGCRHRSRDMARMAHATATPRASAECPKILNIRTPVTADTTFPPRMDQGCASGLEGTAKSRTAEAPIGAIKTGKFAPMSGTLVQRSAVARRQIKAPTDPTTRSLSVAPARRGRNS
jgi:hypothetical protein